MSPPATFILSVSLISVLSFGTVESIKCYSCTGNITCTSGSCYGASCVISSTGKTISKTCSPIHVDDGCTGQDSYLGCYCNTDYCNDGLDSPTQNPKTSVKCYDCIGSSSCKNIVTCSSGTCVKTVIGNIATKLCSPVSVSTSCTRVSSVESCFCNTDLCNGSSSIPSSTIPIFILSVLIAMKLY